MFDPDNANQVRDFIAHRRKSFKAMDPMRSNRMESIRRYLGDNFGIDGVVRPLNITRQFIDIFRQNLVADHPQVLVLTSDRSRKADALDLEAALNYYMKKIGLQGPLERWITESLFSPIAVVKVGLTDEATGDGWLEGHEAGRVFVDPISFDDYVVNLDEQEWGSAYRGNRYRVNLDDLLNDPKIDDKAKDRLKSADQDSNPFGEGSDDARNLIDKPLGEDDDDEFQKKRTLWDIWFPREKLLCTFADASSETRPLKVEDWSERPSRGPYHKLQYDVVPDNLLSLPPVSVIEHLDDLEQVVVRKLSKQAEREKQIGVVSGANIKEGERVVNAKDGEVIPSDQPNPVSELRFGGPDNQMTGFAEVVKGWASYAAGNLDTIGGLSQQGETLGQERILDKNSSQRMDFMQKRVIGAAGGLIEDIAWYFMDDKTMFIPKLARAMAPGVPDQMQFNYPDPKFESSFVDFGFQIEPFSMKIQSPGERVSQLRMIWQQDIVGNPMLAAQGILPNVQKYLEMLAKYINLPELLDFIEFAAPTETGSSEPRQSSHTVRENVRRNVGGESSPGEQIQQLMGAASGGQAA